MTGIALEVRTMPKRKPPPRRRGMTRRADAVVPEIPVRVPGAAPATTPAPARETPPDPREEEIRRMIEAAYT
jgi:hypothetical protein